MLDNILGASLLVDLDVAKSRSILCLVQRPALPFSYWAHDTPQRALRASSSHA